MPQMQGLMDIFDREWCDAWVWTPAGAGLFRIPRDRRYWATCYEVSRIADRALRNQTAHEQRHCSLFRTFWLRRHWASWLCVQPPCLRLAHD